MPDPHFRIGSIEAALHTASSIEVRSIPAADWYQYLDLPPGKYGWVFPVRDGALADMVMYICPELIAAQTVSLSERDLYAYVGTISWVAEEFLSHVSSTKEPMTVEQVLDAQSEIESKLYDLAPTTLQLYSKVQMSVLDQ